jgi:hypothetical protein
MKYLALDREDLPDMGKVEIVVESGAALYLARSQFALLGKSGGMRCKAPGARFGYSQTSDGQRSSAPA